jgi:ABC-type spermidine/putrescine transport system permease subunit II
VRRLLPSPLGAVTLLVLVFLYAPIAVVVANSFNADTTLTSWGGITGSWYRTAIENGQVRSAALTSIEIAALSTVISLVVAVAAGLWTRTASRKAQQLLDASTYMRIILPEVVAALALFILFRRLNLQLGLIAIVIGHVVFNSAYATVIIQARLKTLSTVYEEAASDLGARPHRVFRRVTLPLLLPAIAVAALLIFTFSFDDVITSQFLSGGNATTIPVLLFGMARFRITPELNAIGAGMMTITSLSFVLAVAIGALGTRRRADAQTTLEGGIE